MARPRTLVEFLRSVPVVAKVPMRWGDMDAFKHLNNCVYFQYQECARVMYFDTMTRQVAQLSQEQRQGYEEQNSFSTPEGYGPIMASTTCRYLFPATYPDVILMGGKVIDRDSKQFTLQHTSWSLKHGRVISEGGAQIVTLDYSKGTRADIHPALISAIDLIESKNSEHMFEQFESIVNNKKFE